MNYIAVHWVKGSKMVADFVRALLDKIAAQLKETIVTVWRFIAGFAKSIALWGYIDEIWKK